MKKICISLAAALLLAACARVEAPVETSASMEALPESAASSSQNAAPEGRDEARASSSLPAASSIDAPMPEDVPNKTAEALDLPGTLATSAEGWKIEQLTPAQYAMEAPLNRGGARGFIDVDVFMAVKDGKLTLFNRNGKQISGDYEYDGSAAENSWAAPDGRAVSVSKDGLYGLVDAGDGSILVPFQYASAWALPDYYEVEEESKTTLLLRKQDLSVAYTLERGDRFRTLGDDRELLYQNSTLKLFDKTGAPIKNLVCDEVNVVAQNTDTVGVNRLAVKDGEKWALYDGDGEPVTNAVYDDFNASFKGDYITFRKNGKWGVMDYSGKVTIKPKWDDIILYERSASLCLAGKWTGTMELDREPEVTQPIYDDVGPFSADGYAYFEKDGKFGLLDDEGNVMMTPRQSGRILPGVQGFEEGVYLVEGDNGPGSYGILSDGQLAIPTDSILYPQGVNPYYAADEPYNLVCTPNGKWGYLDGRGQYVIDARFDAADAFVAGLDVAMVNLDGRICLIDRKGNVVLETVFSDCGAWNPETLVCAMRYNGADCLVRLIPPGT